MANLTRVQTTWIDALNRALQREASARGLDRPPPLDDSSPADDTALRQHFGKEVPLVLVGFDTPGIQDFLFGVQRPVDIEGGSRIVEAFVDREPQGATLAPFSILHRLTIDAGDDGPVTADSFVYLGGGSGLLAVARSESDRVIAVIEEVLDTKTHGDLRSVAAALPVWPADLFDAEPVAMPAEVATLLGADVSSSRYAACLAGLDALLSRRRSATASISADVPRARAHDRCTACGRRIGTKNNDEREALCAPCITRRSVGAGTKQQLDQAKSYEVMVKGLGGESEDEDPRIAVIYADGANFGAAFRSVADPIEHAELSRAVDAAVQAATDEAVARAESAFPELARDWRRHQTPLRGGDDIVLVLPARGALEAVDGMVTAFESTLDTQLQSAGLDQPRFRRLGLGVGLVVAEWMFPVQFSLVWAKQLMTSSKRRLRNHDGPRNAVDFMVLRSAAPLSDDLDALRNQHFADGDERRTRRPYCIDDFRGAVHRARALRDVVPLSQVHAMADAISDGRSVSRNLWRVQHARASGPESWAAYRSALDLSLDTVGDQLWTPGDDGIWSTDFLDLVDLMTIEPQARTADEKGVAA